MADRTLGVRASGVIHERLDDEVIAIDLDRGIYFAMAGPAADVWTAFQGSAALPAVIDALAKRYHAPSDALRPDVEAFVEHLAEVGLLVPAPPEDAMQPAVVDEPPTGPGRRRRSRRTTTWPTSCSSIRSIKWTKQAGRTCPRKSRLPTSHTRRKEREPRPPVLRGSRRTVRGRGGGVRARRAPLLDRRRDRARPRRRCGARRRAPIRRWPAAASTGSTTVPIS